MSLYLDASILVPLVLPEARSPDVEAWFAGARGDLIVSDLADAGVRSAISRAVRTGGLSEAQAAEAHLHFDQWRDEAAISIENLPVDIRAAARLVRRPVPKLLAPDAIHLATCRRLGLTLVTHDLRLIDVARREAIAVLNPIEDPPPA